MNQKPEDYKVYLAGPDVFFENAKEIGKQKKILCAEYGFSACFPLDGDIEVYDSLSLFEKAKAISINLEKMMDECDLLIANMTPFRGVSMDVGTAFEAGYMRAQGKPVLGYSNFAEPYENRVENFYQKTNETGIDVDQRGKTEVESFGLTENLMIEIAINQSGARVVCEQVPPGEEQTNLTAFEECLRQAQFLLAKYEN